MKKQNKTLEQIFDESNKRIDNIFENIIKCFQ